SHNSSGDPTPPGYRHPIPTTTTTSPTTGTTEHTGTRTNPPDTAANKYSTNSPGVGKSNITVAGNGMPIAVPSVSRSSCDITHSNPRSLTDRPNSMTLRSVSPRVMVA